ncbi:unnamed protein product, partial [Mesorhabditis spiculigera]
MALYPILILLIARYLSAEDTVVTTKYGKLRGQIVKSQNGSTIYQFLGVPFAKAPIGTLRFEKPVFPDAWSDTRDAIKFEKTCLACKKNYSPSGAEDCLYLNIWTSSYEKSSSPVLVYIHGGSYYMGSAQSMRPEAGAFYASQGIVVVSIAYRLGHWGFLTLNDTTISPNLGLWDQNLALQWVKENIGAFGGNNQRVTIWGDSAGAASVSQHALSKHSTELFHQAIQLSGSAQAAFARGTNTIASSRELIQKVGCKTADDKKKCLQGKKVDEFFNVDGQELELCIIPALAYPQFSPIYDGIFFEEGAISPTDLKPTIIGFAEKEGRAFTLNNPWAPWALKVNATAPEYQKREFMKYIKQWITVTGYNADEKEAAEKDIFNFYAKTKNATGNQFFIEQYVRTFSDFMFNIPGIREAFTKQQAGANLYVFLLEHFRPNWPKDYPAQGSTHSDQYPYTILCNDIKYTEDDLTVKWLLQEAFVQFVKTGNPSTDMMEWLEFDTYFSYLSLKPEPEMEAGLFLESFRFWSKKMAKYSFDFISQEPWFSP